MNHIDRLEPSWLGYAQAGAWTLGWWAIEIGAYPLAQGGKIEANSRR